MEFFHASLSWIYFNYFNGRVILRLDVCVMNMQTVSPFRVSLTTLLTTHWECEWDSPYQATIPLPSFPYFQLFIIINATRAIKNRKQNWTAPVRETLTLKNCTWNVNRLLACQIWLKRLDKVKLSSVTCIDWLMNVLFAVVVVYLTHFTLSPLARISSISVISV